MFWWVLDMRMERCGNMAMHLSWCHALYPHMWKRSKAKLIIIFEFMIELLWGTWHSASNLHDVWWCDAMRCDAVTWLDLTMTWHDRENSDAHKGEAQKSLMRATALIGMAPDIDPSTYDHSEIERYGIGKGEEREENERRWKEGRCKERTCDRPPLELHYSPLHCSHT